MVALVIVSDPCTRFVSPKESSATPFRHGFDAHRVNSTPCDMDGSTHQHCHSSMRDASVVTCAAHVVQRATTQQSHASLLGRV